MVIVVIGAAGSGKTTVGSALASALGWLFVDRDAGPDGLADLHAIMARAMDRREHAVIACPALTERDRTTLRGDLRPVRFVYLKAPRTLLEGRVQPRAGRAGDAELVRQQLLRIEDPGDAALTVDAGQDPAILVPAIRRQLGL